MTVCTAARSWFVWEWERGRSWFWPTQLSTVIHRYRKRDWTNAHTNDSERFFLANWPMQTKSRKQIMTSTNTPQPTLMTSPCIWTLQPVDLITLTLTGIMTTLTQCSKEFQHRFHLPACGVFKDFKMPTQFLYLEKNCWLHYTAKAGVSDSKRYHDRYAHSIQRVHKSSNMCSTRKRWKEVERLITLRYIEEKTWISLRMANTCWQAIPNAGKGNLQLKCF